MERVEILSEINEIFKETLDDEEILMVETTQATDVEGWDSLTHIMLAVGIEKKFEIRFSSQEIQSWSNIGAMIDTIAVKL